jgi:hypothetical protein
VKHALLHIIKFKKKSSRHTRTHNKIKLTRSAARGKNRKQTNDEGRGGDGNGERTTTIKGTIQRSRNDECDDEEREENGKLSRV